MLLGGTASPLVLGLLIHPYRHTGQKKLFIRPLQIVIRLLGLYHSNTFLFLLLGTLLQGDCLAEHDIQPNDPREGLQRGGPYGCCGMRGWAALQPLKWMKTSDADRTHVTLQAFPYRRPNETAIV